MLYLKEVTSKDTDLLTIINKLYERSFPINERKDLKYLLMPNQSIGEILALMDDEEFIGFMCLLNVHHIAHIIYFSIEEIDRNEGYGSKFLELLHELKPNDLIIADLEVPTPTALNNSQRLIRREFYMRNGFKKSEVSYMWHNDSYEILCFNGMLTNAIWEDFWNTIECVNKDLSY